MLFKHDIEPMISQLLTAFNKFELKQHTPQWDAEFGYESTHLVCRIPPTRRPAAGTPGVNAGEAFELQVRTVFMHAYAQPNHDLGYKAKTELTLCRPAPPRPDCGICVGRRPRPSRRLGRRPLPKTGGRRRKQGRDGTASGSAAPIDAEIGSQLPICPRRRPATRPTLKARDGSRSCGNNGNPSPPQPWLTAIRSIPELLERMTFT